MGGETMASTFLEPADDKKHQLACMEIRPGQWHNRPTQRVLEIINNSNFSISIHINITVQENDFAHFV